MESVPLPVAKGRTVQLFKAYLLRRVSSATHCCMSTFLALVWQALLYILLLCTCLIWVAGALQASIPQPTPGGTTLLLPPAWRAFLRLLLQVGINPDHLSSLSNPLKRNPSDPSDSNLTEEHRESLSKVVKLFPEKVQQALQQTAQQFSKFQLQVSIHLQSSLHK